MTTATLGFLKKLLDTPGPSGFEHLPARVWREEVGTFADDVQADVHGNSIAALNAKGKQRLMLAGHIDEIGLQVTHIDDEGFLYFGGIGGWDSQVLVGQRYLEQGFLDTALRLVEEARARRRPLSVGLVGNIAEVLPELVRRGIVPDVLTDQTSAHDLRVGYIPVGLSLSAAATLRERDPAGYEARVLDSMVEHVRAMLALQAKGAVTFDYGNNLRGQVADHRGMREAFDFPGFVPAFIRPLFCRGAGPFRWAALSGDPADIATTDQAVLDTFPHKASLARWIRQAQERVQFQGLPARICWLEYGERAELGLRFNWLVKQGKVRAPIVIGRDHLDTGSVASPNRETEGMRDGSDAIADWPVLNALLNTSSGATWVSVHHGGGVGIGYSLHAGMVIVADGSREADEKLQRVLTCDPGSGVVRHADAGYPEAMATAREHGIDMPMLGKPR